VFHRQRANPNRIGQWRVTRVRIVAAVALLLVAYSATDHASDRGPNAKPSKLDRVLRKAAAVGDPSAQRVIIRTTRGRAAAVADRLKQHGDRIVSQHRRLDAFTASVHGDDLRGLDFDPDVQSVSVDAVISADGAQTAASEDAPADNLLVSALALSDSRYDGDKVGIAVIDSGLEQSGDLGGGRADRFFDFTVDGRPAHPYDDYGHGTHVATLIAGAGKDSEREVGVLENGRLQKRKLLLYRGIAPKARVISLKVLDGQGAGYTSSVLQALEFAIEYRDKLGIDIINLSLGHPIYESPATDPLVQAVEDAVRAGIVVVASAGNYGLNQETGTVGYAGITSPGNAPSAITVGALDMHGTADRGDDTVAPYSSRGPAWYSGLAKPDLVAPGHRLVAVGAYRGSLYERYADHRVLGRAEEKKSRYFRLSGTSMAAAVTSGVVAQMVEANRELHAAPLTPNTVKAILEFTSLPLAASDPLSQGAGGLNGGGAVELAEAIDPSRAVGTWWLTRAVNASTVVDGQSFTWSQALVWGNTLVWGNSIFEHQLAWNQSVLWGDSIVWGDALVWGNTDLVWDTPETWSQSIVWGDGYFTISGNGQLGPNSIVWGDMVR
jgi:serine protease AprX